MFTAAANPYDELITKATDENLASEDWALNLEVCDKVSSEGQTGARNAVGALQKRLAHRNPSVQLYALELANTLAQNCSKPLLEELSSRNWTGALERLINDRATPAPVKKKALGYIKAWAKQFEETGDRNLGIMGELYDQLRAKNMQFDEPEPVPENAADARQRQEDEELQRVLELSKQDKGGRNAVPAYVAAAQGGSSSSRTQSAPQAQSQPPYYPQQQQQQAPAYSAPLPPVPEPEAPLDVNTATRVRALYAFATTEVGELSFERGDVIKVLDRGFKEWWRGACNGKIGIFPVTYVEALAEPSPRELQDEAQEEARVFASLGLVDQLLQTLKGIDPSRGDRIEDKPEIEDMYQASVGLQGQINALIKKYSDQKAELEHMNANFLRAMKQYEELRNGPPQPAQYGYAAPPHDPHAAQYAQQPPQHAQQPQLAQPLPSQPQHQASYSSQNAGYAAAPGEHQYQTYSDQPPSQQHQGQHPPQPSEPAQYPAHDPYSHSQMPQAVPYQPNGHYAPSGPVQHGSHSGQPGQPFYQQQQGGSVSSLNRAPSGAPSLPPNGAPQRQATHSGAAGIGAGSDADREHKAAWDAYYAQQNQNQPEGQHYPTEQPPVDPASVQYGASPYPAQQWPQQGQVPRSVSGTSGVDQVTGGMNRMTVGQ